MKSGDLVTVAFPFTDLSGAKRRPALVLLAHGQDLVLCGVTSQLSGRSDAVPLEGTDMDAGRLPKRSEVRPLKLFTIHRTLVHRTVGRVNRVVVSRVLQLLISALRSGRSPGIRH